ncbi:MAG: SIS domain-containing protein [Methylococcales bacterium]|nr:SIS domain-containing protein [Methylococcales bacterium]MDD5754570.1 SIS domain-containing protein [Methylococcales bacterium]
MKTFSEELAQHIAVVKLAEHCSESVETAANLLIATFENGNKVLLCGNGGSAADAQHIAAEFVVRYQLKRRALPAIALTTDTSILTAHANDFDFDSVFARQIEALGNVGDTLIAISTSGNSKNIVQAAQIAHSKKLNVIALTGENGGALAEFATHLITVPSKITARIQETHILIGHYWCGVVEERLNVSESA